MQQNKYVLHVYRFLQSSTFLTSIIIPIHTNSLLVGRTRPFAVDYLHDETTTNISYNNGQWVVDGLSFLSVLGSCHFSRESGTEPTQSPQTSKAQTPHPSFLLTFSSNLVTFLDSGGDMIYDMCMTQLLYSPPHFVFLNKTVIKRDIKKIRTHFLRQISVHPSQRFLSLSPNFV
jgi:hypothetical protein